MDIDACITDRRSCRTYKNKKVQWDAVGEIIDAATHAPSAGNLQNWFFVIVDNEALKKEIANICLNQIWMAQAPILIVICNDQDKVTKRFSTRGKMYATQSCAIAAGHMMLKAESLGLATCWIGSFDERAIQRLLYIPDTIIPEMILTLGYPDILDKEIPRKSFDLVTYFNRYGEKRRDVSFLPLSKYGKNVTKATANAEQGIEQGIKKLKHFLFKK